MLRRFIAILIFTVLHINNSVPLVFATWVHADTAHAAVLAAQFKPVSVTHAAKLVRTLPGGW